MVEEYIRHPETKSLAPDGTPCIAETRGLLQRAHITAGRVRYIDKETSSMWAQSDDLSVITDNDEAGFRAVEYGKSRKVVLPDSLKREIKGTKLQRELRRRGIGQHTIEKALHGHVRLNTYTKIVSAIAEYKKQNDILKLCWVVQFVNSSKGTNLCHTRILKIRNNGSVNIAKFAIHAAGKVV
jgi:hypothetical protein